MSLEISFWKCCDLGSVVEGTCRWNIDTIVSSSPKEERMRETMCEARQQTSPPHCHVISRRPWYLSAFTPLGSVKWSKLDAFTVFDLCSPVFFFLWRCRPLLVARDLLFSVDLCRHLRCNSLILRDLGITVWKLLVFGGQCLLILCAVWAAKIMHWSYGGGGGRGRCDWYCCGCREWCRQTHQKLLCCSGSVVGMSDLIWPKLAWASVRTQLLPSPTWKEKHHVIVFIFDFFQIPGWITHIQELSCSVCFVQRRDLHKSCSYLGSPTVIGLSHVPTEEHHTNSSTIAEIQKKMLTCCCTWHA